MQPTNKPQCQAARDFIMALHAERKGEITKAQLDKVGKNLNGAIQLWGKP